MNKLIILGFAFYSLANFADPSECNKKNKEVFETEKVACADKKGDEKKACIEPAVAKLKAANLECKKVKTECMEKAKAEKKTAMDVCKDKKKDEKKECNNQAKDKFQEAKLSCNK